MQKVNFWNYRVVRRQVDDEVFYGIHEVYYNDGRPVSCSESPCSPYGETSDELFNDMKLFTAALEHPILDYDAFGPAEDEF